MFTFCDPYPLRDLSALDASDPALRWYDVECLNGECGEYWREGVPVQLVQRRNDPFQGVTCGKCGGAELWAERSAPAPAPQPGDERETLPRLPVVTHAQDDYDVDDEPEPEPWQAQRRQLQPAGGRRKNGKKRRR